MRNRIVAAGALFVLVAAGAAFLLMRERPGPSEPRSAAPVGASSGSGAALRQAADCLLPGPPPVPPQGATASAADMKLGRDVIQAFVLQLEAYQACRNAQIDSAGPGISEKQKEIWIEQGNASVDEAHALADAFSAQLRVFKARGAVR